MSSEMTAHWGEDGILLDGFWAFYPFDRLPFGTILFSKGCASRGASSYQLSRAPYWELKAQKSKTRVFDKIWKLSFFALLGGQR